MKIGKWTEIFRSGGYGEKGTYTNKDLDTIVANFDNEDQVPIVVGHPEDNSPAWGWLDGVRRVGNILEGKASELHDKFSTALNEKQFKNRSVRIARSESGPKLLHLGYLGAMLPQVEGLKQTTEFSGDGECVDYGFDLPVKAGQEDKAKNLEEEKEDMEKDDKIKKLESDLAAEKAARKTETDAAFAAGQKRRKADFAAFVESKLIATGKLPKDRKEETVAFMMNLPVDEKADFSWGDGDDEKGSSVGWFQDFAASLPSPEFVRDLPAGEQQDFGRTEKPEELVDLSHQV